MALMVRSFSAPPVDRREVWRYAGHRGADVEERLSLLLEECIAETMPRLQYRVAYLELPLPLTCFTPEARAGIEERVTGCHSVLLFAATVGVEMDRLIARYSRTQPSKSLLLDALGSERIEALCDAFCAELAAEKGREGLAALPRFSPGYGKLPLTAQRELIALLDAPRKIGLALNESLLMSPAKSVTAIVGIYKENV
ncbi:MAG: Vitamin B12 dependent methionine synthase activation subunit [Clostridia bacterium]|nr:Vitamin B12 dependent methionine synthase activation subunit [Clostridia bacterium]